MGPFEVRPYRPGDEHGILDLFNRVFAEGNPAFVPRTLQTWQALYADNPAGVQVFVATAADGTIIAHYGSLPASAVLAGQRRMATQAVDSCVDRAWRGSLRRNSVFVTIAREFIAHFSRPCAAHESGAAPFDSFMYGLPNEQAFPVGTRVIGYAPVHCPLPALVAVPDAEWLAAAERRALELGGDVVVEEFTGADVSEAAALFSAHLADVPLGLWRDAAYLSWRYRPRADVQYRALIARRAGRAAGIVVFRLGWMGQPLVPLVDWIGPPRDRGAQAALLAAVGRIAAAAGGRRLETWLTPSDPRTASLSALGLVAEATRFNLCIMTFEEGLTPERAREEWVFSMGDTDIF